MLPRRNLSLLVLSLVLLAGGLAAAWVMAKPDEPAPRLAPLALFTSLPLYWGESADLSGMLDPQGEAPWPRALVEQRRELVPLDVLSEENLARFGDLLVAQPRALSPPENVALDAWVRGGGHLLLFADPLLTAHSRFALGDRRRPQDVALLSPILAHWGLELQFDPEQAPGERRVALLGEGLPVEMAGRFALLPTEADAPAACELMADALAARCAIGQGSALVVADAALFDGDPSGRAAALEALMAEAYAAN